eukprot:4249409-Pleurochrysis_carterae.AAC.1
MTHEHARRLRPTTKSEYMAPSTCCRRTTTSGGAYKWRTFESSDSNVQSDRFPHSAGFSTAHGVADSAAATSAAVK